MSLEFQIATGSHVPIYRQIVEQIRRAVLLGDLTPGDQLPTVRALAEQLIVNPNTVAKSYSILAQEGVVEGFVGRGLFVAQRRQVLSSEEIERRLEAALDTFFSEVLFLDVPAERVIALLNRRYEAVEATAVEATAVEATAVEATAVEATAVEATAVEATAVEAATLQATATPSNTQSNVPSNTKDVK